MRVNRRHFVMTVAATGGALCMPHFLEAGETGKSVSSFQNPILKGDYPDPSVVKVGKRYYMTHSAGTYCPAFLIWESDNLVDWRPLANALTDWDGDIWAPDLVYYKNKFYIYYICSNGIHVITADKIEGPWSKPVDLKLPNIDPGHIATPDGKRYLHLSDGHVCELSPDGLSTIGKVQKVFEPWPIPKDWVVECVCLESPKLFYRQGFYHLLVAQGGTAGPATSHMVVHARSKTPIGPWELSPFNPIVHTSSAEERWWSRGHGTAVEATDGSWWLIYHSVEKGYYNLGRCTLMEPLEWTSDGWLKILPGSDSAGLIKRPPGKPNPVPLVHSDEFSKAELNPFWRFWKESGAGKHEIKDHTLFLTGRGKSPVDGRILTRITGDKAYSMEVDVEAESGSDAGLLLFYNNACHIGLSLNSTGIVLHQCGKSVQAPLPAFQKKQGTLRIENRFNKVTLSVKTVDGKWTELAGQVDTSNYNHNIYGGFLDLRPALYAGGNGTARFRHFKYQELK